MLDKRTDAGQIRFVMFDHRIETRFTWHGFHIQWTWYADVEGFRAGEPVPLYAITMDPDGHARYSRYERFLEGETWKFGEQDVLEDYRCRVDERPATD